MAPRTPEEERIRYEEETTVSVRTVADIVAARQRGRNLALELGFSVIECTMIATVISELARNIVLYAKSGEILLTPVSNAGRNPRGRRGIVITARDQGPGILDVQRALLGGYSTSGGLGLGLSGVRRMVDELEVDSQVGKGTTIRARKWVP